MEFLAGSDSDSDGKTIADDTAAKVELEFKSYMRMIKRPADFWCNDEGFFLDSVSFFFKRNPVDQAKALRAKICCQHCEGLHQDCTSKGRKEGSGRKVRGSGFQPSSQKNWP